eukprot:gnl/TRDRNA2_/TRDRNA2_151121_c0_seq1.p1 gnl/TRDRNA2_/TRDRNA2_151121_c0~~gnl/TRDRNA2_/TRDRNA2_151121_c0_seq1.p1  ORF type:complete len:171 (+),score=19.93 gnl/TRDRNA2_/TRDRNA2_151121_c0_seq1:42-554(+)
MVNTDTQEGWALHQPGWNPRKHMEDVPGVSYESIKNDTQEPVEVRWQLLGGHKPRGGSQDQTLQPEQVSKPTEWRAGASHQVCVTYREEEYCKWIWAPHQRGAHQTVGVKDVIWGIGVLTPLQDLSTESSGRHMPGLPSLLILAVFGLSQWRWRSSAKPIRKSEELLLHA